MEERRKLPRRHLYYYSRVFDEDTHEMAGRLVDISREGMMMISDEPIQTDVKFKFKLVLPEPIGGRKYLVVEARSKWCRQAEVENQYDNGFALTDVTEKSAEMIDSLLKRAEII